MICSFKVTIRTFWVLLTCTSLCNAYAGPMGEAVFVKGSNPEVVHMATTYVPQYLSRGGEGMEICRVGRHFLGEKSSNIRQEEVSAMDGLRQCIIKRRKMKDDEYRGFTIMSFFCDAERKLVYKIAIERQFPLETLPRDREAVINGIIADVKRGYRLSLIKTFSSDDRIAYHADDERFCISLELLRNSDGTRQLVVSVVDKKAQLEESSSNSFNANKDIEVSI